jgi:hypothetical protein
LKGPLQSAKVGWTLAAALALSAVWLSMSSPVLGAGPLPRVRLNAEGIGPRPIEDLTGKNITREYADAFRDLEAALFENNPALLDEYFTGFAKDNFTQRISEQKAAGLHVRYTDHGHDVKAVFYSVDGGEMQLVDRAALEVQVFDGDKLIHQETLSQKYMVLMTPGADRWYVRSLDPIPDLQR